MKKGPAITIIVASLAMVGVVAAFTQNASPYVTISQAKKIGGDNLHVAGKLNKESVTRDMKTGRLTFEIIDDEGVKMSVEHKGAPPANIREADRLVAIGGMENGHFVSRDLLLKCPSKYEANTPKDLTASR